MDTIARDYMTANVLEQQGDGGPEGVVLFQIFGYGCVPSFALSTGLSKVSVLYYLLNFSSTSRKLFVFIHAAAIITGVYCVVSAMVSMICINSASMNQRCSRNQVILICGLLNSVGDLVVLILPFIILRPLHTTPMRKVSILMVLLSGGFVVGVSVYRFLHSLFMAINIDSDLDSWLEDETWFAIELCSSIACACLPFITPFARHCRLEWRRGARTKISDEAPAYRGGRLSRRPSQPHQPAHDAISKATMEGLDSSYHGRIKSC
ncbi:hypothetical protein GGTG_00216 [Gaeumannomyces tritici R3-111a-1]|uniref:Rhodopsin domain-containing protein n=1 Tax=Gaeumannomyces tritici (strain R3-111a-1) TaxID=644352 RepID=J3NG23_GAET3|nr:hypothetical protein GGTG_00216 [Gaeumannomyces tritici R3-111a-1]EJT80213.1 hypothetical protein GGTG_00216 [Gaeumannomyces tritici R3-111a-1]